jgi:hypothetical protein
MKCNCNQLVSVTEDVLHPLLKKKICNHIQLLDGNAKKEKESNGRKIEAAKEIFVEEAEAAEAAEAAGAAGAAEAAEAAELTATGIATAKIRYESDHDFMLFLPPSSQVPPPCWSSSKVISSSSTTTTTTPEQRSVAAAEASPTLLAEPKKTTRSASFARLQRRLVQQQQQQQQQQPVEGVSTDIASPPQHVAQVQVQNQQPRAPYNRYLDDDDPFYSFDTLQYSESFSTSSQSFAAAATTFSTTAAKKNNMIMYAGTSSGASGIDGCAATHERTTSVPSRTINLLGSSYDNNDDNNDEESSPSSVVDVSAPEQEQQQREQRERQKGERRQSSKEVNNDDNNNNNNKTILSTRVLDNTRDEQQEEEDSNREEKTAILHMKIRLSELIYPSKKKMKNKNMEYKKKKKDGNNSKKKQTNPYFEIFAAHRGGMSRSYYKSYPLMNSNDGTWEDAFLDLGLTHSQLLEASGDASHVEIGIRVMNIPSKGNVGTSEIKLIGTCQVGLETLEQQQQRLLLNSNICNGGVDVDEEDNLVDHQGPEKYTILNGYQVTGKLQVLSLCIE